MGKGIGDSGGRITGRGKLRPAISSVPLFQFQAQCLMPGASQHPNIDLIVSSYLVSWRLKHGNIQNFVAMKLKFCSHEICALQLATSANAFRDDSNA